MPRRIVLSVFALAAAGMTASAADLPTQSRLGAIFAEPAEVRVEVYREREYSAPIIPYNLLPNPLWNRGTYNYGSSWSYQYPGPYYGGPPFSDALRLPYCYGFFGYSRYRRTNRPPLPAFLPMPRGHPFPPPLPPTLPRPPTCRSSP